jgi:lipopolysaccharide biosynthesis protein
MSKILFYLQPQTIRNNPRAFEWIFLKYRTLSDAFLTQGISCRFLVDDGLKAVYSEDKHLFSPSDFGVVFDETDWLQSWSDILSNNRMEIKARLLQGVHDVYPFEMVFCWNYDATLDQFCRPRNIATLYQELGLLRKPMLYQSDPEGLLWKSSLPRLYEKFKERLTSPISPLNDFLTQFRGNITMTREEVVSFLHLPPGKPIVLIPLQVEHDSNIVAGSPLKDMASLVTFCFRNIKDIDAFSVIIKKHPGQLDVVLDGTGHATLCDTQVDNLSLINAADYLITINSSSGFEALCLDKKVFTLGKSPYAGLGFTADVSIHNPLRIREYDPVFDGVYHGNGQDLKRFLFFAIFQYHLSEDAIINPFYYMNRFRLMKELDDPDDIYWKHKEYTIQDARMIHLTAERDRLQTTVQSQQRALGERGQQIAQLMAERELHSTVQSQQISERDRRIGELEAIVTERDRQIDLIHLGHGWRLLKKYFRLRDQLLPYNTRRKFLVKILFRAMLNPKEILSNLNRTTLNKFIHHFRVSEPEDLERRITRKLNENTKITERGSGTNGRYHNPLVDSNTSQSTQYLPLSNPHLMQSDIRLIAFYLPQFHPIPENDDWWGTGFTEWTNVTKAVPQFIGHDQPRLPGELGFYDLRIPEVMKRQIELAKMYGIYGFCFHFYWFHGKTLLERPLEQFLSDPDMDIPFCINWANESWTKRWDGLEKDVLIGQAHSSEDDIAFIEYVSKYLKDRRYIRIGSRPLLIVYRPALFPDAKKTAERWRKWCRDNGIGEIYLALTHSFEHIDPRGIGFDAAIEFAPNTFPLRDITGRFKPFHKDYTGQIFDYESAIDIARNTATPPYRKFRGLCPGWDNAARKPGRGITLVNATPEAYRRWLEILAQYTHDKFAGDERMIFINAWNEWAEGAYLEPDRKYGYAYLEATAEALLAQNQAFPKNNRDRGHTPKLRFEHLEKRHDTAVILHLYYPAMWEEIQFYLRNLNGAYDLFVSIPYNVNLSDQDILDVNEHVFIYRCNNHGRDILPFLNILSSIHHLQHRYALKIHTKRSSHRRDGTVWRKDLYDKLCGSPTLIGNIRSTFDSHTEIAIIAPQGHLLPSTFYWGQNVDTVKKLAHMANIPFKDEVFKFVAGSMFWFRPSAFRPIVDLPVEADDFEAERGQVDGTLAHAMERFFGLMIQHKGQKIAECQNNGEIKVAMGDGPQVYPFAKRVTPS